MAQLRQDYPLFKKLAAEILVAGPEKADAFKTYWQKHDLPFLGLPDPEHEILKLFGQEVNLFKLGRMPAMVIVDRHGVARFAHYGHQMSDIPDNQEILTILADLNQEAEPA